MALRYGGTEAPAKGYTRRAALAGMATTAAVLPSGASAKSNDTVGGIGLFSNANKRAIPDGVTLVQTSGWNRPGWGNASYILFDLGSVGENDAFIEANPLSAFRSANGRYFRLIAEAAIDLRQTGAAVDGVTDDAPALRAAMAALKRLGGGTILVPPGTCYLRSGDTRGLNMARMSGVDEYYAVCEAVSGVILAGVGDESILLYESNRLGENLHQSDTSYRQDGGVLFANFRVAKPNDTPAPVTAFTTRNVKFAYTPVRNQNKDMTEGQLLRLHSAGGAVHNGTVLIDNVSVASASGHQAFCCERVQDFVANNVRFIDPGAASNRSNTDFSAFYISGLRISITNSRCDGGVAEKRNGTFLELHGHHVFVEGNSCQNMGTFLNAVSQIIHPGPEFDNAQFNVTGNIAHCRSFVTDWCYTRNRKNLITIQNNQITLITGGPMDTETVLTTANDMGDRPSDILPTQRIVLQNNIIQTDTSTNTRIDVSSSSNSLITHNQVEHLVIERNSFIRIRRGVIALGDLKLRSARICYNKLLDVCKNGTNSAKHYVSRTAISITAVPHSKIGNLFICENEIRNGYTGTQSSYGIRVGTAFGRDFSGRITIRSNDIIVSRGHDIALTEFSGSTFAADTIEVDHHHSIFGQESFIELIACGASSPRSFRQGSVAHFGNTTAKIVDRAGNHDFIVHTIAEDIPKTRYWPRGSTLALTTASAGGYASAINVAAGRPGTWRYVGKIRP